MFFKEPYSRHASDNGKRTWTGFPENIAPLQQSDPQKLTKLHQIPLNESMHNIIIILKLMHSK